MKGSTHFCQFVSAHLFGGDEEASMISKPIALIQVPNQRLHFHHD